MNVLSPVPNFNKSMPHYSKSIMVMLSVLNNPALTLQLGILGKLLGLMGRIVKECVREVSLAQVSCILMYVYVAPPTPVGAWLMALGLRQRIEYYYKRQTLHFTYKLIHIHAHPAHPAKNRLLKVPSNGLVRSIQLA